MTTYKFIFVATMTFTLSHFSYAGDAAAGKAKAATCGGCHGMNGISNSDMYPNLAGQKAAYMVKSIKAYKTGVRNDPTMKAMTAVLTDADIDNLAAYFSGLSCK